MKKKYISLLGLFIITTCGCSDFLNLIPKNKVLVGNVEDVRTELYTYLASITYQVETPRPSFGGQTFRFPFYNDVAGQLCLYEDDIDMLNYSTNFPDINDAAKSAYNESVDWKGTGLATGLWGNCYGTIGFMNTIIDNLSKFECTKAEYETIGGEAKVIRAYHIFKLLQFFAPYKDNRLGIPLNLDSENVTPSDRWKQSDVYRVIIDELNEVLGYTTGHEKWNIFYRPEIVKAILAQVYWFKAGSGAAEDSDWKNAEKYSAELIADYVPEDQASTLTNIFSTGTREYSHLSPSYLLRFSYRVAWSLGATRTGIWLWQYVSDDLLELYGKNDIRLEAWFIPQEDEPGVYAVHKPVYTSSISEITVLFRTADLYLMNAEAQCHLNNLGKAREMLETFKDSRISQYDDFRDDEILQEIYNERRKEFCYEIGTRWLDMKRLGLKISRMGIDKDGQGNKMYTLDADDYRYTLPIPASIELDHNKIEQNPGWGNLN